MALRFRRHPVFEDIGISGVAGKCSPQKKNTVVIGVTSKIAPQKSVLHLKLLHLNYI